MKKVFVCLVIVFASFAKAGNIDLHIRDLIQSTKSCNNLVGKIKSRNDVDYLPLRPLAIQLAVGLALERPNTKPSVAKWLTSQELNIFVAASNLKSKEEMTNYLDAHWQATRTEILKVIEILEDRKSLDNLSRRILERQLKGEDPATAKDSVHFGPGRRWMEKATPEEIAAWRRGNI